jgi:hypothetical protein
MAAALTPSCTSSSEVAGLRVYIETHSPKIFGMGEAPHNRMG